MLVAFQPLVQYVNDSQTRRESYTSVQSDIRADALIAPTPPSCPFINFVTRTQSPPPSTSPSPILDILLPS